MASNAEAYDRYSRLHRFLRTWFRPSAAILLIQLVETNFSFQYQSVRYIGTVDIELRVAITIMLGLCVHKIIKLGI